jgi:small ligand-binding sensory domain FIST
MFGDSHHDAAALQDAIGPLPVAGMFCAGELGPVGARNVVHGFTASVALFGTEP